MNIARKKLLEQTIINPLLIKKKENLFYLTGRFFMDGYLLVMPRIFTRISNAERRGSVVFFGNGLEATTGIKSDRLKNLPLYLSKAVRLDLEDEFTFAEFGYIKEKCRGRIVSAPTRYPIKIQHINSPVDDQRTIKDETEIRKIRKSMQIVEQVFLQVKANLRRSAGHGSAWTEIKLAEFIKNTSMKFGAQDISFPPIMASGANAAIPHHQSSNKKLKAGESIIIDFGFKYQGYCSDFTRTVFLDKVGSQIEMAYNQVEKAYNKAINYCNSNHPGQNVKSKHFGHPFLNQVQDKLLKRRGCLVAGDVFQRAIDVLAEKNLDKYFIHALGHGTGLEIHESPRLGPDSKEILKPNMVFSIEPGVYVKNRFGIRIEDLVLMTATEVKKFIHIPTEISQNIIKLSRSMDTYR